MAAHIGKFRERIEEFLNKYPAVDDVVGKASAATKVCVTWLLSDPILRFLILRAHFCNCTYVYLQLQL